MRTRVKLREMREADVRFISLVSRGANRIPFRIVKSDKENGMLNLDRLGRVLKSESRTPQIVGMVVLGQDEPVMKEIAQALSDLQIPSAHVQKNEDETVMFSEEEVKSTEGMHLVRLSENTVVVVKGMGQHAQDLTAAASLNEDLTTSEYFHGIDTACEAFTDTVKELMKKAESRQEITEGVQDSLGKFSGYVSALVNGVPAEAFKADILVGSIIEKDRVSKSDKLIALHADMKKSPDGVSQEKWDALTPEEKKKWLMENMPAKKSDVKVEVSTEDKPAEGQKEPAKEESKEELKEEPKADSEKEAPKEKAKEQPKNQSKEESAKKQDEGIAAILQQLTLMNTAIEQVSKSQKELDDKVQEVAKKSDETAQAMRSTVLTTATPEDQPAKAFSIRKQDNDPRSGVFDTAYLPRRKA